jgi:hypothetical protein
VNAKGEQFEQRFGGEHCDEEQVERLENAIVLFGRFELVQRHDRHVEHDEQHDDHVELFVGRDVEYDCLQFELCVRAGGMCEEEEEQQTGEKNAGQQVLRETNEEEWGGGGEEGSENSQKWPDDRK